MVLKSKTGSEKQKATAQQLKKVLRYVGMRGKKRKITKRRKSLKSLLTKPPSLISWRTGLSIFNKIECKITHSKEKKQKKGAKKSFVTVILSVSLSMSLFEKKTQLRYRANEGTLPHLDSSNSHLTIPSLEGLGDSRKRPLSTWTVLADHKHDVSTRRFRRFCRHFCLAASEGSHSLVQRCQKCLKSS